MQNRKREPLGQTDTVEKGAQQCQDIVRLMNGEKLADIKQRCQTAPLEYGTVEPRKGGELVKNSEAVAILLKRISADFAETG